jgi:hypothetical protein
MKNEDVDALEIMSGAIEGSVWLIFVLRFMRRAECMLECLQWAADHDPDYMAVLNWVQVRDCLELAAKHHNVDVMEWVWSRLGLDIHFYDDLAFRSACWGGNLETAQWLVSLGGVDIHADNDFAFYTACENGHLETAQWLVSQGGVDIHVLTPLRSSAFINAGRIQKCMILGGLLASLKTCSVRGLRDLAFRRACKNCHLETAQWLVSLGGVDIHADDDFVFYAACGNGHLEMAQWLMSLGGVDIHNTYASACYVVHNNHDDWEMARWLLSLEGKRKRGLGTPIFLPEPFLRRWSSIRDVWVCV